MAFAVFDFDSVKSGFYGTSYAYGVFASRIVPSDSKVKLITTPRWLNFGNYSTSAGTSGTGGTTINIAGDYTWIG